MANRIGLAEETTARRAIASLLGGLNAKPFIKDDDKILQLLQFLNSKNPGIQVAARDALARVEAKFAEAFSSGEAGAQWLDSVVTGLAEAAAIPNQIPALRRDIVSLLGRIAAGAKAAAVPVLALRDKAGAVLMWALINPREPDDTRVAAAGAVGLIFPVEQSAPMLFRAMREAADPVRAAAGSSLPPLYATEYQERWPFDIDINKCENFREFDHLVRRQGRLVEPKQELPTHQDGGATYEEKARQLSALSHDFRQQVAAELAPTLNARIQAMPHDTLEEKKELARWVNDQLEPLGLAVKCPKTGLPAKLRGVTGNWPGVGRFTIEIYTGGKQKVTTVSDQLPELTLTDATPPLDREKVWQQAVGPKENRKGPRR